MKAGRELDLLVAEHVMGGPDQHDLWYWWPGMNRNGRPLLEPQGPPTYAGPRFSTDIAAAREMEDELERRGLLSRYVLALVSLPLFLGMAEFAADEDLWGFLIRATPEQRCLAALKACRAEVPG